MAATAEEPALAGVREVLAELGVAGAETAALTEIPGGASRETYAVELAGEGGEAGRRFVLRRDPPGAESLVPQAGEFRLLRLARDAGVPVPEALHLEPGGGRFGTPGMLLSFVGGQSVAPRVLRREELAGARRRLTAQWGEALARIHAIDTAASGLPAPGPDPALGQIEHWEAALDAIGEPLPAVELGLRWLRANRPEPVPPRGRARGLPARQLHRRRAGARGGDRLGAGPPRRSGRGPRPGSASAPGASARTPARSAASVSWRSSSPPTSPPAARRRTQSACATGRYSATSSGR